jgi:hypothetical protein
LNKSPAHLRLVQRLARRAVGQHALRHFEAVAPAQRRRRLLVGEIVDVAPVVALQEQQVAESLGRDECDFRALALEHGVGRHGRAVTEIVYALEVEARCPQCVKRADIRAARRAGYFRHHDPLATDRDQVGERTPHFDAHAHAARSV